MAKSATSKAIAEGKREPQYHEAIRTMRGTIKQKKDRISGINGEIKGEWDKIRDGFKVDTVGAKMFMALDKLEPDERAVAYRCFLKLAEHSDWPEMEGDLVDQAEDVEVDPRKQSAAAKEAESDLEEIECEEGPASDDAPADPPKPGRKISAAEASRRAKSHLQAVK